MRVLTELGHLLEEKTGDNCMSKVIQSEKVKKLFEDHRMLTQFILDCTSFNLPDDYRLNVNDKKVNQIFKLTRDLCYSIHSSRIKSLKDLAKLN